MVARYQTSVVGLIDILGVSARLSDPATAERYAKAVAAIFNPMISDKGEWCFVLPHVDEAREVEIFLSPAFSAGSTISFISDSIVVSSPIDAPGDRDGMCVATLACLETIKALQRSLLILGLRSRGGISIGGLIHSGELLVGDGLLRAYELERHKALTPRTVVDPILVEHLIATAREHFPVYLNRVAHALREDEDGQFFVDYLTHCPKDGYCGLEREFPIILQRLKTDIEEFSDSPWLSKIEWLLRYASASFEECRSKTLRPFDHANSRFSGAFPRTNSSIVEYMNSDEELERVLKMHGSVDLPPRGKDFFRWPLGWTSILDVNLKDRLNAELTREVSVSHELHGQAASVLGRFGYSDEFLFLIEDGRVAQVHLTWNAEDRPDWPWTRTYASFFEWAAELRKTSR